MRASILKSILLVAMAILLGNCQGNLFSEKVEGYPFFNISAEEVDFGLVDVNTEPFRDVYVRNLGSSDSELRVFFALLGDPAFRLLTADEEYRVGSGESLLIRVAFAPQHTTIQTARLVVYYSDRPLREELNVGTFTVQLSGIGRQGCEFPDDGDGISVRPPRKAMAPRKVIP